MQDTDQTETPTDTALMEAIESANEIWGVVGRGGIAFRFGPFTKDEVAPMMHKAMEEGVGMTFIIQSGKEVDWAAMREIAPATYDKQPST